MPSDSDCPHRCPQGQPCTCTNHRPHTLHVCRDTTCACHAPARYGMERAIVHGRDVYKAAGDLGANVTILEVKP